MPYDATTASDSRPSNSSTPPASSRLRLGYKASAEQFGPVDLLRFGVEAEQQGFDSVFVSDHLQPWWHDGGHAPAAIPWLAALGAATSHITIGTSVLTPTFRYHPGVIAQAFATLGCLYPGRVVLGVGSGEALNEVALGSAWPDAKERFARLKEAIDLIQTLWRDERINYQGTYYQTDRVTIYDLPDVPVPIYLAASGPSTARLAGRVADGFITTSGKPASLYQETLLPAVRQGVEKAGRPQSDIDLQIEVKVSFDADHDQAVADTRHWATLSLTPEQKVGIDDPLIMQERAAQLPMDRVMSRWIVSSDPDEHVERIATYLDMGFRHLIFHAPGPDQSRFLALYGRDILPALRTRFAELSENQRGG